MGHVLWPTLRACYRMCHAAILGFAVTGGAMMTVAMRCRTRPYIGELCGGLVLLALLGPDRVRNPG